MAKSDLMPQWLKEIVNRGFKPEKIYSLPKGLFSWINRNENQIETLSSKLIFSLEGLPGSGKTSTVNSFTGDGVEMVPQILPKEPDGDGPPAYFLRSEELKTEQVLNSKYPKAILDRYYVSTLAFYWATDKLLGQNFYPEVFNWYKKAIKERKIIKPFIVFYLKTPLEKSYLRTKRTADENSEYVWLRPSFLVYWEEYCDYFYSEIEPHTNIHCIDSSQPLENIISEIKIEMSKYEIK